MKRGGIVKKVDTCGMGCPQPVLMTKKALEENPAGADIIVDNNVARDNVARFLKHSGYSLSIKKEKDLFVLEARK